MFNMSSKGSLPGINNLPLPPVEQKLFTAVDAIAKEKMDNLRKNHSLKQPESRHPTKGAWSAEEDELLKHAVSLSKPILWDVVAESVPGRSAIQCKERWLYRLDPDVKKTRFERWEDELIIKERERVGNRWTLIANKLPGRTSCAVKNRWYSILRNSVTGTSPVFE